MTRAEPTADRGIMRLVAELYYERELNQPEIAELTGFSISKVSRLLTAARDQGVVRITVEAPQGGRTAAAEALASRFGVEIQLTPGGGADDAAASRLAGLAAADHLAPRLPHEGLVGIAAGYTVAALVSGLPALGRAGLTIVPVVGGWDIQNQNFDGNELARRMAERFGARSRSLHAPAVLDSPATKEALLKDSAIGSVAAQWDSLDLVVLGVGGAPYAHPGYRTAIDRLEPAARAELAALDVVGDIACHFLGRSGRFLESWSARTLAIPIEALRRVPTVFAIAAGLSKAPAILAALRTGILQVLVTDAATAAAVAKPYGDYLVLKIIKASRGAALAATDDEIRDAVRNWAQKEGVFAAPEGAASLAAYYKLLQSGILNPDVETVLFNTGTGLKYLDVTRQKRAPATRHIGGIIGPY